MKKNDDDKKQGDLFNGFEPETETQSKQEKKGITVQDVLRIFGGRVVTEEEADEEVRLIEMERNGQSGEELVDETLEHGVFGFVQPDFDRVKWYKEVFAEDDEKRKKGKKGL
jgi:hypothetical protein